ncbi:uncharacterized protein KIAA1671 homolog isoform X2 [Lacerta agilis]|uniref:uncharacterized protein KIAA1671 homolog isoform X2 n=1 Tax=Lacerta agilis TaxID=80427 RepID=UPI0014197C9C|nr:uncharacterized protein KIAA1671 homolog isoform X2 [Lacerta agilis]
MAMRAMATKVEVSSVLTSLTNRSELVNEATHQQTFASNLSDTSNKPNEHPSSVSPQISEGRSTFGNPMRPATMPPATSRPRLTPKPFSREKSWDTFAVVKAPVPTAKPGNVTHKPFAFAKNVEDNAAAGAKGMLSGSIPPLVEQKLIENKSTSELVANMPFYSSPQANTVILFETRSTEETRMKLSSEKTYSTLRAQERQLPPESEMSYRRPEGAAIHRQLSVSSESKPVSCNPHRSLERKESFSGATEERPKNVGKQQSSTSLACEEQPRPKQRPVSAIFLESLKDQKQCGSDVSDEKPNPEMSWVRKPRPLSMDLTAKFEIRDFSIQRKSCPSESKERNLLTNEGSSRPFELRTKSEAEGLNRVDPSKSHLKSATQVEDCLGIKSITTAQIQKPSSNEVGSLGWNTPKDLNQVSAKDRKYLWEMRLKTQEEENGRETDIAATSGKNTEPPRSEGQSGKERMAPNHKGTCAFSENSANVSDTKNKTLREGSIKKAVNLPDAFASCAPPVNAESFPESPGKESKIMNIQQRIKELTAENTETKPGNLRQSFRSRPLSADLTKLFSNPVTSGETKPERQSESNMKPVSQMPDIQEDEAHFLHATDSREVHSAGTPWKPQQPLKIPHRDGHLERDGSFAIKSQNVTLQGESPALVTDHDMKTLFKPPIENVCIKTVRATMFEHNVQRHHIAADHFEAESTLQAMNELVEGELGFGKESWLEKAREAKMNPNKVSCKQANISADAGKQKNANISNEDKVPQASEIYTAKDKYEKPTAKHVEDSFMYQRIEPRYEILQTVGKRVQSEAIAVVPEDKAVTLRSSRFLKERRKTDGSAVDASWTRSPDMKGDGWKDDSFLFKERDAEEISTKVTALKEVCASQSQYVSHKQGAELDKNLSGQQHETLIASYFTNREKDLGKTDDTVSKLSSGTEKRKSDAVLVGKMESFKMLKCFPESFEAGPDRTDGCEARANGGQNISSPITSKQDSQPSLCGMTHYQWQKLSSKCPHPEADPTISYKQEEESKAFGLMTCPMAYSAQEERNVLEHKAEVHQHQQLSGEEMVRRSGRHVSGPKASERWRRKTLPHDAVQFEKVGLLAQESGKAPSRRDSLQLHDKLIAKRNTKPRYGAEPQDGSLVSPSSPDNDLKNQLSPSEPKATYFAVTYQIPDENTNISGKLLYPLRSKHISSLAKDASVTPNTSTSRRSYPPNYQYSKRFTDAHVSLDRHLKKNWIEGGEGSTSDLPKKGTFKHTLTETRDGNLMALEKRLDDAKARATEVDPLHLAEPGSLFYFRPLHWDSEHLGQKKCSNHSHSMAKGKASDYYRSKVLDIDALMAQYEGDSKKDSVALGKKEGGLPEDSSSFPWERLAHKRNSSGSTRQDIYATELCIRERELLRNCDQQLNPSKARDVNFSPPFWARAVAEKPKYSPAADPVSTRKKTFIVDDDQGEDLVLRHQSAKYAYYNSQVSSTDVELETSFVLHPPQVLSDRALGKDVSLKQLSAVHSEGNWSTSVDTSGADKKQAGAGGSSLENDSSAVKSRAKWSSTTSGLACDLPDLKRSYSEKSRQSRARGSLPSGPETRGRQDQNRVCQSFPPESTDSQLNQQRTSQRDSFLHERTKKDVDKEWTKQDRDGLGARNSPYLPLQQRSHSFYKDKRTDHWAADQLKQCFGRPAAEAKDTDTLVQETDSQYGTWSDQRPSVDSFVPESPSSESNVASARKQLPSSQFSSFSSQTDPASATDQHDSSRDHRSTSLDRFSTDVESADGVKAPAPAGTDPDFSFLEQTPVLDSSVLKTRVQLSKRRRQHRAPISHSLRRSTGGDTEQRLSVTEEADSTCLFKDSTENSAKKEDSGEEGHPQPSERSPVSQLQRLPVFPGMDHSALKAQLRKRHEPGGTGEGSPVQLSKSPKFPFQAGVPGGRVLPVGTEKEERSEEPSPQWLKELKSKKRQSQYENQV